MGETLVSHKQDEFGNVYLDIKTNNFGYEIDGEFDEEEAKNEMLESGTYPYLPLINHINYKLILSTYFKETTDEYIYPIINNIDDDSFSTGRFKIDKEKCQVIEDGVINNMCRLINIYNDHFHVKIYQDSDGEIYGEIMDYDTEIEGY